MGSVGARKASGRREGAELAPNVGSGRLVHHLGDSERSQSGDLLRHLLTCAGQPHGAGKRDEVSDVRLVTGVGLDQMSLVDHEMSLSFGGPLDRPTPSPPARSGPGAPMTRGEFRPPPSSSTGPKDSSARQSVMPAASG